MDATSCTGARWSVEAADAPRAVGAERARRRLAKDFQATIESALARILVAQIRRLTREGLKSMTFISSQTLSPLGVT